jgi:AcrR family transcriptional regulator
MATSTPRKRRAGNEKRVAVLDAVLGVLADRGFEQTRFTDVATASGVAVGTLQNYFGSREDMLIEALRRAGELEIAAQEAVAAAHQDPWDQLVALIDRSLQSPDQTDRTLVELWRAATRDEELREYSDELRSRYRGAFVQAVNAGHDQGTFELDHDPDDVVDVLLAVLAGGIFSRALDNPQATGEGFRAVLLAQLAAGLGAGSKPTSTSQRK